MNKNYYEILGVNKSANEAEIKKAYKKKALEYHPDRNKGDKKAEEKFKEVNEAYQILGDPEKKKQFDQFGSTDFSGFGGQNPFGGGFSQSGGQQFGGFEDIFSQFSGMGGNTGKRASGGTFGGFGDIFSQFSGNGRNTKPEHDQEEEAPNLDVTETIEIPFLDFLSDQAIPVQTVYAKVLTLKIKAGTRPGTKFKIRGKGRTSGNKTGDMYVIVDAKMPKFPLEDGTLRLIEALKSQL